MMGRIAALSRKDCQAYLCVWPRPDCSSLTYIGLVDIEPWGTPLKHATEL